MLGIKCAIPEYQPTITRIESRPLTGSSVVMWSIATNFQIFCGHWISAKSFLWTSFVFFGISGNSGRTVLCLSQFRPMSSSLLILTRSLLYQGVLLVHGRDFLLVSPQSYLAGLFFFLCIVIGRSFLPTWQCCNGGGSPCSLPSQVPYSGKILVAV